VKRLSFIIVILLIVTGLIIGFGFISNFSNQKRSYALEESHESIRSVVLNLGVLEQYLEYIDFKNTKSFYAVEEKFEVSSDKVDSIRITLTDEPQGKRMTYNAQNEEVVGTSFYYFEKSKTLEMKIYLKPSILQSEDDKERSINYHILSGLYYLRYRDFDDYIGTDKFDFYGSIDTQVRKFLETEESVANYEFTL